MLVQATRAIAAALTLIRVNAAGQVYPSKPIRFIVPFPPDGGNDLIARTTVRQVAGKEVPYDLLKDFTPRENEFA